MGAELFHADGQTAGVTRLIVAFRNFANAPKLVHIYGQKINEICYMFNVSRPLHKIPSNTLVYSVLGNYVPLTLQLRL